MKIRKRDINGIMFVLVLFAAFLFQGCGNPGLENADSNNNVIQENSKENSVTSSPTKKEDSLLYFSNDVSIIKVTYYDYYGVDSWNLNKEDIPQFREWVLSLQLECKNFEKGESPRDYNGEDAYDFQITGSTPLNFTFMDIGDNTPYIEIEGKWYRITNHISLPDFLYDN